VVWKGTSPITGLDGDHRITYALGDLIGTSSAVIDLLSAELVETSNYCSNGAREIYRAPDTENVEAEPMGVPAGEAEEEVGLTYFGERYLISRCCVAIPKSRAEGTGSSFWPPL